MSMLKIWLQVLLWLLIMAVLVFWPAGTLAYPGGWALVAIFAAGSIAMVLWFAKRGPRILRERLGSPIQSTQKPWDRVFLLLFMAAFFVWIPLMAADASRHGFHAVPLAAQIVGAILVLAYMALAGWTFQVNAFAAPVVKVQSDQQVIDSGPYAVVRHPMYSGALLFFIGVPLLLGSWWGLLLSLVLIVALAWRAVNEERELREELSGYADYMRRVPYRLVPKVW
jgi:protein-S-isoprenylcysteine O-methyltransferase Ste14